MGLAPVSTTLVFIAGRIPPCGAVHAPEAETQTGCVSPSAGQAQESGKGPSAEGA